MGTVSFEHDARAAQSTDVCSDALARFSDELLARADSVVGEATDAVMAAVPVLQSAARRPGIARVVEHTFVTVVRLWREQRDATAAELDELVATALPPARAGIGLDDLLHAYRVAADVVWRHFSATGRAQADLPSDVLLDAAPIGWRLHSSVCHSLTIRHRRRETEDTLSAVVEEASLISHLVDDPPRLDEAVRAARRRGLHLVGDWTAAVLMLDEWGPRSSTTARPHLQEIRTGADALLVSDDGEGSLTVLASGAAADLDLLACVPDATLGIGRRHQGPLGARQSYVEACIAADIARRRGRRKTDFANALLDRFLLGRTSATELVDEALASLRTLPPSRRAMLLETLETHLDHGGSVARTARALHLHRQSVNYRLDVLARTLGPQWTNPEGRLVLHLAIKAAGLRQPENGD